jgi:peptide/nickel transport system ATP-binding protein
MAAIFVTHDIGVAVEVADKLAVMYAGEFVETGSVREIISEARHPYTRALLAANLHGVRKGERLDAIPGAPPALSEPPGACSFAPRCRFGEARCVTARPPEVFLNKGRLVRCILAEPAREMV